MKKGYFALHTGFYLLLYFGGCVSYSEEKENDNKCVSYITCKFEDTCIDDFRKTQSNYINAENCLIRVYYNGYYYVPIHIIYKLNDDSSVLDQVTRDYYIVKVTVMSLDFSENGINFQPNINNEMDVLEKINISHNNLQTARFYNSGYKLNSLRELDFSYNSITTLEVDETQNVFDKLITINLSHNDLLKIPDNSFKNLNNLQYLDLSNNKISEIMSNTFEGISSLKYLNLSFNNVIDINTSLFRFKNLVQLKFGNNKIVKIEKDNFYNLNELQFLDLRNNFITSVDNGILSNLSRLVSIDLSDNKIQRLANNPFTAIDRLENINLSYNNITHIPKNMFYGKNISMFSIKGNNITGSLERGVFEGLDSITDLDISHQSITSIKDFTFFGLIRMTKLLLNNNLIYFLSSKSFVTLQNVIFLDLSYNRITNIDFEKTDLVSLKSLSFSNNLVEEIKVDQLFYLHRLQYLDISHNNITELQPKSFQSLTSLDNILLFQNPLTGTLEENTFDGLFNVPLLDLSGTSLNVIQNSSFDGMIHLYDLNISHSKVAEVQYNSFLNTENIETIDLSYNRLENFAVNTSHLKSLKYLKLDNNNLKTLSQSFVRGMLLLNKITLSHNKLLTLSSDTFQDQRTLNYLDLSFNVNFNLDFSLLKYTNKWDTLKLSGTLTNMTLEEMKEIPITNLDITCSNVHSISFLNLQKVKDIQTLLLSKNNIAQIEFGDFLNLSSIKKIDVSYNGIKCIEPGVFKDCHQLRELNISHNNLSVLRYGIFKGLVHLNMLDISYNNIVSLETARFYDLQDLNELVVDHNRINEVSAEDLFGTRIKVLSIGDNPLPCESLIQLMKSSAPKLRVTSIRYIESKDDNHNGIGCNYYKHIPNQRIVKSEKNKNNETISENLLIDIRDILFNISSKNNQNDDRSIINNNYDSSLINKIGKIEKENKNTNQYLDRLLSLVSAMNVFRPKVPSLQGNLRNENNKSVTDKLKVDFDNNIVIEKEKMFAELSDKLNVIINQRIDSLIHSTTVPPASEHRILSKEAKSSVFIEICVVLILIILICFVLYFLYKSRCYIVRRRSASARHISETENSNL